jgi:hypothetical protein
VGKNGDTYVLSARKSVMDHMVGHNKNTRGGLSNKEIRKIIARDRLSFHGKPIIIVTSRAEMKRDLRGLSRLLREKKVFENLSREEQTKSMRLVSLLEEQTTLKDFCEFLMAEREQKNFR